IRDAPGWRRHFTESGDPGMRAEHAAHTLFYRRLLREMATFLGCEPSEAAVIAARQARDAEDVIASVLRAANFQALLIDQGYPRADQVLPNEDMSRLGGCRVAPILRLETLMQDLIIAHDTLDAVEQALRSSLADLRGQGYVALKS